MVLMKIWQLGFSIKAVLVSSNGCELFINFGSVHSFKLRGFEMLDRGVVR